MYEIIYKKSYADFTLLAYVSASSADMAREALQGVENDSMLTFVSTTKMSECSVVFMGCVE